VSKVTKTLEKVLRGDADANIRFGDLCALLHHLGFLERVRGDHHIFTHDGIVEILNLQPRDSKAKPYQVKQVRGVITAHGLAGETEEQSESEKSSREAQGPEMEERDGG
jgi:predicted RNA binding protein YcfA (HicA-like mRNA interferase family)